ncbi:hypothetical protein HOP50_02g18670 [Chloropicon primus]|nr:hypothetical protein HOP50_02g18670 [Chloropicon primus]
MEARERKKPKRLVDDGEWERVMEAPQLETSKLPKWSRTGRRKNNGGRRKRKRQQRSASRGLDTGILPSD